MTTPKTATLLPCPFCGGQTVLYQNKVDFVPKWSVGCGDCHVDLDVCEDSEQEAAVIWNTRAPISRCDVLTGDAMNQCQLETAPAEIDRLLDACRGVPYLATYINETIARAGLMLVPVDAEWEKVAQSGVQTSEPAVAECSCAGDAGWPVGRHDVTCPAYSVPSADQPPPKAWLEAKAEIDAGWPDTSVVTSTNQLCSCKASYRDGQHMAWCPVVTSQEHQT